MDVLVIWVICGLIAGYIYRNKGRSELVGCIGGFILGPFGILLALVSARSDAGIARQNRKVEENAIARGEMKRCPHCAEIIRTDARVCKHCGREVSAFS